MKKIILLLLLLPIFGFSQTTVDLANWAFTANGNAVSNQTYVTSENASFSQTGNTAYNSAGLLMSNWGDSSYQNYRYMQITIAPTTGNLIFIQNLNFRQDRIGDGPTNYKIKYYIANSSDSYAFSETSAVTLVNDELIANNLTKSLAINRNVGNNQKLIIRFYARGGQYNGNGWRINANTLKVRGYKQSALSGTYYINSTLTPNFATLTEAISVANTVGVSGPVIFALDNANYNASTGEIFPITINKFTGTSATNTLTIKPNNKAVTIESNSTSVFNLNAARNIIINGNETLTLFTNKTGNELRSVITLTSTGNSRETDGANDNVFKNLTLKQTFHSEGQIATALYSNGISSRVTLDNVKLQDVSKGIYLDGSNVAGNLSKGWVINNISFVNSGSNKPSLGIYFNNAETYTISNSTISDIEKANTGYLGTHSGIIITGNSSGTIFNNVIKNITNTIRNGFCTALYLNSGDNLVYNNAISNISYNNYSNSDDYNYDLKAQGIYVHAGANNKIYHNTIVMNSTTNGSRSASLFIDGGTAVSVLNNIFYNAQTNGVQYAINCRINKNQLTINNNDYYSNSNVGYLDGDRNNIAAWRTATGQDSNSLSVLPAFVSATDFQLAENTSLNETLIGSNTLLSTIPKDIKNATRIAPSMGAYEVKACIAAGDQTTFGTNSWIGYVYNNTADTTNPPATPFASANYKGYVTENELFDRDSDTGNFSGLTTQLCGTYNDHFAVRYKMRKNFPAGTYVFTVGADDGYRLKVGTATVIDNFLLHSYVTSESAAITLSGNTDLILEYYEDMTHSRVSFSYTYTPCVSLTAPTGIVQSVATTTCTTGDSVVLTAQGGTPAGTTYQWGTGSVAGTNPIAGETGASITVSPTTATTYWVRRFSNDACATYSTIATTTVTPRDRNISGTGEWIGYVYSNYTNNAVTPAVNDANYRGYVTENAIFDRNAGNGPFVGRETYLCNAPSERFFVRYKMTLNLNADIYNFTVGGDDGYRLYIDGVLTTINNWNEHSYTSNSITKTFATAGTHTFILEYYNGPTTSHVSFTYNKREGDPTEFGNNVWNVYGYNEENIDIDANASSYAGYFVDPSLGINSEDRWAKTVSPSAAVTNGVTGATGWAGGQIGADNFTVVHKRKGFPCGLYQLKMDKWDDAVKIYLDGTLIFNVNGYNNNANTIVGNYYLNSESKMEVRLREGGGDAYVKMTLTDKPSTYTSAGWSAAPENTSVVVSDNLSLTTNLNVCSCTVKAGKKLVINANAALNVMENVVVESTGNIFVKNTGSLVQIKDNATFTGDVNSFTMERNTTPMIIYDFTYWSSPVVAQNLKTFSPLTLADKYYSFNGTGWVVENANTTSMTPGKGYIIRAPQGWNNTITNGGTSNGNSYVDGTFAGGTFQGVFKGKANAGDINVPILGTSGSSNLIGNPYSSPVSVTEFMKVNTGKIDGNFYFWTHKTRVSTTPNQSGNYSYSSQDYAVYNKTGGVATSPIAKKPDGNIAAGQGFFVNTTTTGGNIVFKNSMRVTGTDRNSDFFRNGNTVQTTEEDNRYWISLANADGLYSEFLLGYVDGATNGIDESYDGVTYSSGNVMLYTVISDNKLAIQGRQYPFAATDAVPVGYKVATAGQYTISINRKDGLFENQAIYLFDKTTNEYHDLTAGDFTFTSTAGTFDNRFEMRYVNETLGVDTPVVSNSDIVVYKSGNQIEVKAKNFIIDGVQVYDITGKSLFSKKGIDNSEFSTSGLNIATQVVIVKVTLDNNQTVSKKVIMN